MNDMVALSRSLVFIKLWTLQKTMANIDNEHIYKRHLWDAQKHILPWCMLPMRIYSLVRSKQFPLINLASVLVMFLVSHFVSVPWIPFSFLDHIRRSMSYLPWKITGQVSSCFFFFPASLAGYERYGGYTSLLGIHQTMDIAEDHGKHRQRAHIQKVSTCQVHAAEILCQWRLTLTQRELHSVIGPSGNISTYKPLSQMSYANSHSM